MREILQAGFIRKLCRMAGVLFLLCMIVVCLPAKDTQGRLADGTTVEMPPYEVRADRLLPPPETWLYVSIPALVLERGETAMVAPGYELLSNLSEKNTRVFVNDLQLRQLAGLLLWPSLVQMQTKKPAIIILDESAQAGFSQDLPDGNVWTGDPITMLGRRPGGISREGLITGLQWLSAEQGFFANVHIQDMGGGIVPSGALEGGRGDPLPAGFVDGAIRDGIYAARVNAGNPLANYSRPGEEQLAAAVSQDQAVLTLTSFIKKPPVWFILGIGRLVASTEVSPTKITFARLNVTARSNTGTQINMIDGSSSLGTFWSDLPEQIRSASVSSLSAYTPIQLPPLMPVLNKSTGFSAEEVKLAEAFVHYGFYGYGGKFKQKLMTLVQQQTDGREFTEAAFKEVFGIASKKMEMLLVTYLRSFSAFTHHEFKGRIPEMPKITLRKATQAESAYLQAQAYVILGRYDLGLDKLRVAYWRNARTPAMLAMLASLESQAGSIERARKITATLMKLAEPPPRTYATVARLQLTDALANKTDGEKISNADTGAILDMLSQALKTGQYTEEVFATMARTIMVSQGTPDASVVLLLKNTANRYPENNDLRQFLSQFAAPDNN